MVTIKPLGFEQLKIGDTWTSADRAVAAGDLQCFASLSILAGLSSSAPAVLTAALIDIRSWSFIKPVFVGDVLQVVTEIIDLKPRGRRHGEVHWYRQLFNQKGEKVQDGILVTLVSRRMPLPNKKSLRTQTIESEANSSEAMGQRTTEETVATF